MTASRRRRGFTLIEVLLVLTILVILGSLAVTAYGPIRRRANIRAAKSQVGLFKTALGIYQEVTGAYPTTAQGLQALRDPPADLPDADPLDWPILENQVPLDRWGNDYRYECPGRQNPRSYDLWSAGPDGVDGTEDDIGNWQQE